MKANWKTKMQANERSETRRRCQEEAVASESKKEKDVSLTRDLSYDKLRWRDNPRFRKVTRDANKSVVSITHKFSKSKK